MSIQSELNRLSNAKSEIKAAIESKGVQVPDSATLDEYGSFVRQIPGIECQHPVGFIFEWAKVTGQSVNLSTPEKVAQYFGYGTWAAFGAGQFLLGVGGSYQSGNTGGESEHALTIDEIPSHVHNLNGGWGEGGTSSSQWRADQNRPKAIWGNTGTAGGGQAHNNMPPYIVVYRWQRIA